MVNKKAVSKKCKIVYLLVCLAIAMGVGAVYYAVWWRPSQNKQPDTTINKINYERSDAEKKQEITIKEDPNKKTKNEQRDTSNQPTASKETSKLAANVVLTNAGVSNGKVSASGFVSNVVELGGTCMFTFTKTGQTITKKSDTLQGPSSTSCKTVSFDLSELGSGVWAVGLEYQSSRASGTASNPMEITVQ